MLITLLQRYSLWIFIVLSCILGLAAGHLAATALSIYFAPEHQSIQQVKNTNETIKKRSSLVDFQAILERNIFNSAARQQAFDQSTLKTSIPNKKKTKISSKWVLVGTISGGPLPLASLRTGREVTTFRLNEKLPDDAQLSLIERNRVELLYPDGHKVVLETPVAPTSPGRTTKTAPRPTKTSNGMGAIESIGENRWLIPAQVAENTRSNVGTLLQQAQAVPYLEGKTTTGFQIRMIKRGSLIEQLGLKKGDILREVNGVSLSSPEKALQIFGQLRQAKNISIGLDRRGKAMIFAYEIR